MVTYILAIVVAALLLGADQLTKIYIANNFVLGGESKELLNGIIDITYIHNDGAAWGMMNGHTWLLIAISAVVIIVCFALLLKYGLKDKLMFWAVVLVLSGGIGNLIDRIFRGGEVIDFLQFAFWKEFPVFNVADCAVVVGAGLFILYFVMDIIKDLKNRYVYTKESPEQAEIKNEEN